MEFKNTLSKILFLCIYSVSINADSIAVNNKTDEDLFVAIYYKTKDAELKTGPIVLARQTSLKMDRPDFKMSMSTIFQLAVDRELVFSTKVEDLKFTISKDQFQYISHTNIGYKQGSEFYIARDIDGKLRGFNTLEWKVQEPLLQVAREAKEKVVGTIADPIKKRIQKELAAVNENPHKNEVAQVRIGNELNPDERAYLAKRMPKVKSALEKLLGHSLDEKAVPKIALVESGGGYRAMTCSVGWHVGATKIGLMDAISYMVGLSGSTWSIGGWVLSGQSIQAFKEQLIPKMATGLDPQDFVREMKAIAKAFLVKAVFDQEITLVDLYGGLLANALLKDMKDLSDDPQRIYLSQQVQRIANADLPFPIYTAIRREAGLKQDWFEFTPYEIGASWLSVYVPTWAYGRQFENGKSIDFAPEQSFGYLMGTFGSVFSASIKLLYEKVKSKIKIRQPFEVVIDKILDEIGQESITTAVVNNFSYGSGEHEMNYAKEISMADAGLEFNLPYPPVSGERVERKADILIFLDASGGVIGKHFGKVEQYARDKGLKFPKIDYADIEKRAVSIFKDENDPAVPLIIYMPRVNDPSLLIKGKPELDALMDMLKDFPVELLHDFDAEECTKKGYCGVSNLKYDAQQMRQLSGLTEFNMLASKEKIRDAIEWKVQQLNGGMPIQASAAMAQGTVVLPLTNSIMYLNLQKIEPNPSNIAEHVCKDFARLQKLVDSQGWLYYVPDQQNTPFFGSCVKFDIPVKMGG